MSPEQQCQKREQLNCGCCGQITATCAKHKGHNGKCRGPILEDGKPGDMIVIWSSSV